MSSLGNLRAASVLGILLLAGLSACTDQGVGVAAVQHRPAVPVHVATAVQKDVPIQIRAIGTVEPYVSVTVRSRVEGHVSQVHFREGQLVHAGDLLFSIDAREFEAALRQAEANVQRGEAEAENAGVEARRLSQLLKQQIVSQDEYDQAQTRAASMRATVAADRAAVEGAKLQIIYCNIRSPIEGRIGKIVTHVGNVVKPEDTVLAVVNQLQPIYVAFSVPQQDLPEIRQRVAAAALRVDAHVTGTKQVVQGELTFIDNQVNTETGTVMLKAVFGNQREELWPGQFVDTVLTLAVRPQAVVVPSAAVQTGQQGHYVFAVNPDNTVDLRIIHTGEDLGSEVVVEDNLRAGERVVTEGQFLLAPGMTVEVKEDSVQPPAGAPPAPAA